MINNIRLKKALNDLGINQLSKTEKIATRIGGVELQKFLAAEILPIEVYTHWLDLCSQYLGVTGVILTAIMNKEKETLASAKKRRKEINLAMIDFLTDMEAFGEKHKDCSNKECKHED